LFLDILASSSSVITDRKEDSSTATQAGSSTVTKAGSFHSSFMCSPTPFQMTMLSIKFLAAMKAC
jgi:hypothetical protein